MSEPFLQLGQYQIVEEIGRGGMAIVYRAVQQSTQREVAVKVLPAYFLQDEGFLQRFHRETQVISQLEHPHILPVYDFGDQDNIPYIVMRLLRGGSLSDLLRRAENGMDLEEVARMVKQVGHALDFAHNKGIIHRDFKPGNVMLDEQGNTYLSDFGIAKVTEATLQLTGSGVVGTPVYMAPEMSTPGNLSPLVDVYALGVTIYEMITGDVPYRAETPIQLIMMHIQEPIPDARQRRPGLPDKVQAVIEQAMAKDRTYRYQSAGELAEALENAVGVPRTLDKTGLAQRRAVALGQRPPQEPQQVQLPKLQSTSQSDSAIQNLTISSEEQPKPAIVSRILNFVLLGVGVVVTAGLVLAVLISTGLLATAIPELATPTQVIGELTTEEVSTEEPTTVVVTATDLPMTNTPEPTPTEDVLVPQETIAIGEPIQTIVPSPDGSQIAIVTSTGMVLLNGRSYSEIWHTDDMSISQVEWIAGGARLIGETTSVSQSVVVWDVNSGDHLLGNDAFFTLTLDPDIALTPRDTLVLGFWTDPSLLGYLGDQFLVSDQLLVSSNAAFIAAFSLTHSEERTIHKIEIINQNTLQDSWILESPNSTFTGMVFGPLDEQLAVITSDNTVEIWNLISRTAQTTLVGHTGRVNAASFTPDGTLIASGGEDGKILLWEVATGQRMTDIRSEGANITALAFSPGGQWLFAGTNNGDLLVWDAGLLP